MTNKLQTKIIVIWLNTIENDSYFYWLPKATILFSKNQIVAHSVKQIDTSRFVVYLLKRKRIAKRDARHTTISAVAHGIVISDNEIKYVPLLNRGFYDVYMRVMACFLFYLENKATIN